MYPSNTNPEYGVFVKNFETSLSLSYKIDFSVKSVISGRGKNKVDKIIKYLNLYISIIFKGLFKKYDLIYVNYGTHCSIPLLILLFFVKRKMVINIHGADIPSLQSGNMESERIHKILFPFFKKLSKKADLLVSPSKYYKTQISKKLDFSEDLIHVYPSGGINSKIFMPLDKNECKNRFDLNKDDFVIGYAGGIKIGKGWDIYLKSLKILKEKGIKFKSLVSGTGHDVQNFLNMVKELDLEKEVNYLGQVQQKDLCYIFNSFDVFIFPTFVESLGLSGIEALACGVPVIGSNIYPLKDYIFDNNNGFLFEIGNENDLADKIIKFYNLSVLEKENFKLNSLKISSEYKSEIVNEDIFFRLNQIIKT